MIDVLTRTFHVLLFLLCLTAQWSCKKDPPVEPHVPTIALTPVDASCTEAWLKVTTTQVPATVRLLRDNQRVSDLRLLISDTLLIDEVLLPRHTYTYQLQRLAAGSASGGDSSVVETSASIQVTTMDTTSHEGYTWSVDTLGVGNSSALFDVTTINDTIAYAVGAVYVRDSIGSLDPIPYNLARWNGRQWNLKRIQFHIICGGSGTTPYPARSIFAFSPTDIWIAMDGDQVTRWNGEMQTAIMCLPVSFSVSTIWGKSASSLFAVGSSGNTVFYNGSSWEIQQGGTTMNLRDVYGDANTPKVWAAGYQNDLSHSVVLEYGGQAWRTVRDLPHTLPEYSDSLSGIVTSVWAVSERLVVAAADAGMYRFQTGSHGEGKRTWQPPPFSVGLFNRVRGSAPNNIFVVGAAGTIAHFNGVSWHQYQQFFSFTGYPNLLSVSVKEKVVVAVGYTGGKAISIQGRK